MSRFSVYRRLRSLIACGSAVALVTVSAPACATASSSIDPLANDFVRAQGTAFMLGSTAFRFIGFNLYDAAAAGESYYSCLTHPAQHYTSSQLSSTLAYIHHEAGATVLRFWAYQTYTRSGTDWSGVDEVLRLARANGMRVLPVIEDGPGNCTTGPKGVPKYEYQSDTWYESLYNQPYGSARLSYTDYVRTIVTHYRNDPTILGWEMMNEATTPMRVDGQSAVVGFARTVGSLIHSLDTNHLVTVGTESDGYPGASGSDYGAVYGLAQVDFGVAHDYQMPDQKGNYDPFAMNGLTSSGQLPSPSAGVCQPTEGAPLACSVAEDLQRLHKPMVIDEVAVPAKSSSRTQLEARSRLFDKKFAAAFDHGVSGELVWDLSKVDDPGGGNFDVLQYDHDPLIQVMMRWSSVLHRGVAG